MNNFNDDVVCARCGGAWVNNRCLLCWYPYEIHKTALERFTSDIEDKTMREDSMERESDSLKVVSVHSFAVVTWCCDGIKNLIDNKYVQIVEHEDVLHLKLRLFKKSSDVIEGYSISDVFTRCCPYCGTFICKDVETTALDNMQCGWVSVKTRLPEANKDNNYLVVVEYEREGQPVFIIEIVMYLSCEKRFVDCLWATQNVTHWMNLPSMPVSCT